MVRLRLSAGLLRLWRGDRYRHPVQLDDPVELKSPLERDGVHLEGYHGIGKGAGAEVDNCRLGAL